MVIFYVLNNLEQLRNLDMLLNDYLWNKFDNIFENDKTKKQLLHVDYIW